MRIPLIVWLSFWLLFLPGLACLVRWRVIDRSARAVGLWAWVSIAMNVSALAWTRYVDNTNNMIVSYFYMPIQGVVILWAIAEWQTSAIARSTVRICIPLLVTWWVVVFVFFEDSKNFSILGGPVLGLLTLSSALFALVSRIQRDEEPMASSSWGWILPGIAVYFATNTTVTIVQAVAAARLDMAVLLRFSLLKAYIDVLALLVITGGYFWPTLPKSSGASSLPAPSR